MDYTYCRIYASLFIIITFITLVRLEKIIEIIDLLQNMPLPKAHRLRKIANAKNAANFNSHHTPENVTLRHPEILKTKNHTGRRAIAFRSILEFVDETNKHSRVCKKYKLELDKEVQTGLSSRISFKCLCGWKSALESDHSTTSLPVNMALVWGCQNSAVGRDSAMGLMTALDFSTPSAPTFFGLQTECKTDILRSLEKEMALAANEEKKLAIASEKFVVVEGVEYPAIRVVLDGGWSKRTYGHGYNANCGAAVIIGARTGKVLHLGTRIKTCLQCSINQRSGNAKAHECEKNWTGSSTAMESSIILEGFQSSRYKHGLVYSSFVGDGDSSVHSTIQYVYPGLEVKKIECLNHVVRNFKTKLFDISKNVVKGRDAEKIPLDERKVFNCHFPRFEISIRKAVNYYQDKKTDDSWRELAEDIKNIPMHVFGDHSKCKMYFCKYLTPDELEENLVPQVSKMKFWKPLQQALNRLCVLSKSLVEKETSNKAECFMSIANKFMEGKRKNWGQGYMYRLKMASTVFSYNNTRFWIGKAYRLAFNKKPSDC